jgi:hypothetical protein
VSAPTIYRRSCRQCGQADKLVLVRVLAPSGWQTASFTLCGCDAASKVPKEWRSVAPHPGLVDLVRQVRPEKPIQLDGSPEPISSIEGLVVAWGDLTRERRVIRGIAQKETVSLGAVAPPASTTSRGAIGNLTESRSAADRGPLYDAACQYLERRYAIVLLHGTEGDACTCRKGAECRMPGKHPVSKGWTEHPIRTEKELRSAFDARLGRPTNIGIVLDRDSRLLLIDVDVKNGKRGRETLADWSRKLGLNFEEYLTQVTPSGGQHYPFRVPTGFDQQALPNGTNVGPGIDVLREGHQFVVSPSTVKGCRYGRRGDEAPVVLPPIDQLPEAPEALLEHLRATAQARARTRPPIEDLKSLEAPSMEKLRAVVGCIPNGEHVGRGRYVWMAYRILAAGGHQNETQSREIFLDWAAKYPGANREEDERVFDTLDWKRVRGGWPDLWPRAAKHGYDASEERAREAQAAFDAAPADGSSAPDSHGGGARKESVGAKLFRAILANPDVEVFHASRGKRPYLRLRHRGRWQTHSLDCTDGVNLLRHILTAGGTTPSPQAFEQALVLLKGHARFEAPARDVFVRVARIGSTIYLDLGDDTFRAVEITRDRWSIIDDPPVNFVRSQRTQALPEPLGGGSIGDFRPFFPTGSDDDLRLHLTFLVDTFAAPDDVARPILVFDGPPGSAKTTMTRFAKELTDPQVGGLSALPNNERDLVIAARSNHVVALDNASTISLRMSDALSRLTAGGGIRTRKLYTDEEETVFDERRHVILNSIGDVAKQTDLRDRALFISTGRLTQRRDDEELAKAFETERGRLLGVLLDAAVAVLANEASMRLPQTAIPRMAGFAKRGVACAEVLGWSAEQFLKAYRSNIDRAAADYADDDLVAHVILSQLWRGGRAWLKARLADRRLSPQRIAEAMAPERWKEGVVWRGSATDLLDYLEEKIGPGITRKQAWPRDPRYFGRQLRMATDALRAAGWELTFERNGTERIVVIRRLKAWEGAPPNLDDTTDLLPEVGTR